MGISIGGSAERYIGKVVYTYIMHYEDGHEEKMAVAENDNGEFVEISYATSEFDCRDCYAIVDATDDVRARYEAWTAYKIKKARVISKLEKRAEYIDIRNKCKLDNYHQARLLVETFKDTPVVLKRCINLLTTPKFRSSKRKDINSSLRAFLFNQVTDKTPFTLEQLKELVKYDRSL